MIVDNILEIDVNYDLPIMEVKIEKLLKEFEGTFQEFSHPVYIGEKYQTYSLEIEANDGQYFLAEWSNEKPEHRVIDFMYYMDEDDDEDKKLTPSIASMIDNHVNHLIVTQSDPYREREIN